MSVIDISGLPGDSIQTSCVAGVIAAATLAGVGRVDVRELDARRGRSPCASSR